MAKEKIIQIKVSLNECYPEIWRSVVVSEKTTLFDLHLIIQVIMGWSNSHLHEFLINEKRYSDPRFIEDSYEEIHNEKRVSLKSLRLSKGDDFTYTYDFGDDWIHTISIEDILLPEDDHIYPICLDGERSAPPEDSGGPFAYEMFLQAIKAGNPEEFDLLMDDEWFYDLLEHFDPEAFNLEKVNRTLAAGGHSASGNRKSEAMHEEAVVDDFVGTMYEQYSLPEQNETLKHFCLDLPLRKDVIVILKYLSENRVIGTKSTGNFPLKAVKEMCLQFDSPIDLTTPVGGIIPSIRSEDDVFRMQFLHIFSNMAGLIVGDNGAKWELTVLGKAFLELTPVYQVMHLVYAWFTNVNWSFLFPLEFADDMEYSKFVITTLVNLIYLDENEFIPFSTFADQILEMHESTFLHQVDDITKQMYAEQGWLFSQEEKEKARKEMALELAYTVSEQMIVFPMLDFGILEAIARPDAIADDYQFASICLTEGGKIILESLWKRLNPKKDKS